MRVRTAEDAAFMQRVGPDVVRSAPSSAALGSRAARWSVARHHRELAPDAAQHGEVGAQARADGVPGRPDLLLPRAFRRVRREPDAAEVIRSRCRGFDRDLHADRQGGLRRGRDLDGCRGGRTEHVGEDRWGPARPTRSPRRRQGGHPRARSAGCPRQGPGSPAGRRPAGQRCSRRADPATATITTTIRRRTSGLPSSQAV